MLNDPKFMELLNNKDFAVKLLSQETPEDVQKLFAENGLDISMEEIDKLGQALAAAQAEETQEELSEEQLMGVSGGVIDWIIVGKIVVAVGGAAVSLYKWYKSR